jgi:superfamily II DNA/RNA helicase
LLVNGAHQFHVVFFCFCNSTYTHCSKISGTDSDGFTPLAKFSESGFDADILKITASFSVPSPIQAQCWPVAAAGRDCVGIAETGSGKTLGFSLPAFQHIR